MATQGTFDFGGDVSAAYESAWEVRSHHGYHQAREGVASAWRFYVTGFDASSCGTAGTCSVLRFDGSEESVPIDEADRILVAGKWYGRSHWNH